MAVPGGGTRRYLYVYSFLFQGTDRAMSSWSKWEFPNGTRILGLDMADGLLGIVRKHTDGAYLEQADLDLEPDAMEKVAYLDRRVATSSPSYNPATGENTYTLPYEIPTDGSGGPLLVVNRDTGAIYTPTRPSNTQAVVAGVGSLSGVPVYIGQPYTFRWTASTLYVRGDNGLAETGGRLQLKCVDVFYQNTTDLKATVTPQGRPSHDYIIDVPVPADGMLRLPVLAQNIQATLTFVNDTPGPCALDSIDWTGDFTGRGRRI